MAHADPGSLRPAAVASLTSAVRLAPPPIDVGDADGLPAPCDAAGEDDASSPPAHRPHEALDWEDLVHVRELGRGTFGVVGLYSWRPGASVDGRQRTGHVAVKTLLHEATLSKQACADFTREAEVLAQLKHPALTAFIGVGSHPLAAGSLLFLVTEAARGSPPQPHLATRPRLTRALQELGGDLRTLVIESLAQPNLYSNADVYRWLHDVASGLSYLHTRTPLVIHRDMKLENVLITASGSAKITDFGLVKVIDKKTLKLKGGKDETFELTGGSGSLKYMAPENFKGLKQRETIDQYSYSIIAWELTARCPLLFMRTKKVPGGGRVEYTPKLWALDSATKGVRPELRPAFPPPLRDIMAQCWHEVPSSRPPFSAVVAFLSPHLRPEEYSNPKAWAVARGPASPRGGGGGGGGEPGCGGGCCVQ